jgi:hypothetical protein
MPPSTIPGDSLFGSYPADRAGPTAGPPPPSPYAPWRRIEQDLDDIATQLWILHVLAQRNDPAAAHPSHERVLRATALLRELRALVPHPLG